MSPKELNIYCLRLNLLKFFGKECDFASFCVEKNQIMKERRHETPVTSVIQ